MVTGSPRHAGLVLEGDPIVVVQDGRWIEKNLKRERLTQDEVLESAREQSIGSLSDVEWAILETSGQITIIKKSDS